MGTFGVFPDQCWEGENLCLVICLDGYMSRICRVGQITTERYNVRMCIYVRISHVGIIQPV